MKRTCNETERERLFKNRDQLLKGIFQATSNGKFSTIFIGLIFSIIFMFAGIYPLVEWFDGGKLVFYIWAIFCLTVPNTIVSIIIRKMRVKKEAKRFLKKENLMINGATVVDVDLEREMFSYIEDDFLDEEGKPMILDYPVLPDDFDKKDIGRRMLVMYESDTSFQLMKVNDELRGLISNYSEQYPLMKEMNEYKHLPHPNAKDIDYIGHTITEEQRDQLADVYVKVVQGEAFKVLKVCSAIIFICVMMICTIIGVLDNCLPKTLFYGISGCVGFLLFLIFIKFFGKYNIKRKSKFVYLQEVVFHSNVVNQRGKSVSATMNIYEWNGNRFELVTYPAANIPGNTPYGSILYKLVNEKGDPVFLKDRISII